MLLRSALLIGCLFLPVALLSANDKSEIAKFQGNWKVVGLVENGQVIPEEAIKKWLPSGGLARITDNAIMFQSRHDGQSQVKLFSIDATQFPKGIEIRTRDNQKSQGIYRFEDGQLIVCMGDPALNQRPTDFSAAKGSNRVLMTLARLTEKQPTPQPAPQPAPPSSSGVAAKVLTDAEVRQRLVGVWQFADSTGPLLATINANGTFTTSRDVAQIRLFQTVFSRQLESTGTWSVQNGQLVYHIATSTRIDRAGLMVTLQVRSISGKDLIFVDGLGRVGTAVRVN